LTLTTSGGLCGTTSGNKTITVDPLPTIAAGFDENVCDNSTLVLFPASGTNYDASTISWSVLSGCACLFTSGSTTLTPTFTPDATGSDHTAIVQILVNGNGSCSSSTATSNKNIIIYATPGTPLIHHD
jgi:H+/Cl- antiporter ClcA